ncbi:IucC family-domain-containing protein [Vararia minispora EC-137]|uniref:IucC family-domain-containing protein n=1 Tax=Vararia minispora EC-137 TaxID=1314806 RepID=A0ACB8QHR7_9AGAM|nr:IucC family-domain-containing protein [Vararia minispora EC-137]
MDFSASLECAQFSASARLLSALVTESLARAIYLPVQANELVAFALLLSARVSKEEPREVGTYGLSDILIILPLKHVPVLGLDDSDVRLLDPLDLHPIFFFVNNEVEEGVSMIEPKYLSLATAITQKMSQVFPNSLSTVSLQSVLDPALIWHKFVDGLHLENAIHMDIAEELASSVRWQAYLYQNPPRAPTLDDPSIVWEQSVVEGHNIHPVSFFVDGVVFLVDTHKMRKFLPPIPNFSPGQYDLDNPKIRLIAIPRGNLRITGDFESLVAPIIACAVKNAGQKLHSFADRVIIPIHELQVYHILDKFPDAQVLPAQYAVLARAQLSTRSLVVPGALTTTSLKLPLGIKLTSAVRTISPASAYFGPRFSTQVVPTLKIDPEILTVAKELASVVHTHPDDEIAKHCAVIVRECHENGSEERGERLIVCTSLVEYGHAETDPTVPLVVRAFGLDTEGKRLEWLENFARMLFAAFLPPMLVNGVSFEVHSQNTVARYSLEQPPRLLGFVIRDLGGIRVHPETLRASTGIEIDVLPGHSVLASSIDEVYTRMYHTAIYSNLHRLVRVLGLHYNGKGWNAIRESLREQVPPNHPFERAWLGSESRAVLGKCLLRMRLVGAYRHHLHTAVPNLLHYAGAEEEERRVGITRVER